MKATDKIKHVLSIASTRQAVGILASRYLRLPLRAYPYALQIYLDTICNLNCFFCLYAHRSDKPGTFDIANLEKLRTAIQRAQYISLSAWGEPLLSPNLRAVLNRIYQLNSRPDLIAIVTNGTILSAEMASLLSGHLVDLTVSLNAATEKTYSRDMGGNWRSVLDAIIEFMQALPESNHHKIGLHMVAHTGNYREISELIYLADRLGIKRVRVDQMMIAHKEQLPLTLLNVKGDYNRMVDEAREVADDTGVHFTSRKFGERAVALPCLAPWSECHVWVDGRVAPCCYNGTLFLGNAYQGGFESVWFGKDYEALRQKGAPQCHSCPKLLPFDDKRTHIYPYLLEMVKDIT